MKRKDGTIWDILGRAHPYPFWLFIGCIYAGLFLFLCCAVVVWFPEILSHPQNSVYIGEDLFRLAGGLVAVGGISAPLMDLIWQRDHTENNG